MHEIMEFDDFLHRLVMPRGMVGDPFELIIELTTEEPFKSSVTLLDAVCVGVNGITAVLNETKDSLIITGMPESEGVLSVSLEYKLGGDDPLYSILPDIFITPDPKTLWKNIPPDPDAPYQVTEHDCGLITSPQKTVVAASKRGRSHAHDGRFREDHFRLEYLPESGWYIVAVSDGAGSAEFAREGSRIACSTFCSELSKYLTDTPDSDDSAIMNAVLKAAYQGMADIHAEAKNAATPVRQFSATLLGYVMRKFAGEWLIISFGVGDGIIGLMDTDDKLHLLTVPDGGEFVGQTRFLTMNEVWQNSPQKRVRKLRIKDFRFMMSMTDGVSDPKFETDLRLNDEKLWQALWEDLASSVTFAAKSENTAQELCAWLDFWSRGNHDDRTITIAY